VVDARAPFPREEVQEADEREDEQERRRRVDCHQRDQEADRRQGEVDDVDPAHEADSRERRDAVAEPRVRGPACEVEHELRAQRRDIDRPVPQSRISLPERGEDEHRPERVPGVRHRESDALEVHPAADVLREPSEQQARCDDERHPADRRQEEHRDEHELRRDRGSGSELELDPGGDCIRPDQDDDRDGVRRAAGRDEQRQR
jgi:hypothetical protein